MKKVLILTLLLITLFSINAQITTNIWGLTIGKSTKQQVKNVLKKKGYRYEAIYDNSLGVEPRNGIDYAGAHWTAATFGFYNNTLYYITFLNYNDSYSTNKDVFEILKMRLDQKYHNYYYYSTEKSVYFDDGTSRISLLMFDNYKLGMQYSNDRLQELKEKSVNDEL